MVGRRDPQMHHCGLCSGAFTSKAAYNQHMATHQEPEQPRLLCPVCPFKFDDSYALETHKAQTGHGGDQYTCNKCGKVFQTQAKFRQHSQFPSPCYADASRTRPIRNTSLYQTREVSATTATQTHGHAGYVDLDTPVSAETPVVLPYGNSPDPNSRSPTPSNVSGVYCHDCKRSFRSMALYNRHCLSCTVQNRSGADLGRTAAPAVARLVPSPQVSRGIALNPPSLIFCGLGRCSMSFHSQAALEQHQRDGHNDLVCGVDGCGSKFQSQSALDQHRKSVHILLCDVGGCGKPFQSKEELFEHKKNHHAVGGHVPPANQHTQSRPAPTAPTALVQAARTQSPTASSSVVPPPAAANGSLICGINSCPRAFRSEAGLKQHKIDSHSVGGRGLDLQGRDNWMLPQNARNQLRDAGVYRPSGPAPHLSRGGRRAAPPPTASVPRHLESPSATQPLRNPVRAPLPPAYASNDLPIGGPAEIDQANELQGKTMRMLITADIAIRHDGNIVYDGVAWRRIGVARQNEAVGMFDELVHLRRLSKQGQAKQHVSHPTTFQKDFVGDYLGSDFEQLPEPRNGSLSVIALCCSKVLLENRCEEVVKIAAVDVPTGRPLMSYLVCTSATEKVRDWRATLTGLSSFQDFEAARTQKFKILKGWMAARAALGKFVDQNTIILGYNLRSDLDALRIRHGRCVDLIKLVEKAAENRPLSRKQLRLETLLRDLLEVRLPTDLFGRDCLQDAFAVRGLALLYLKDNAKFVTYAREKAREYGLLSN
ncbi:hypothetical protein P171DRAFT_430023 [Karstenula rhodostoma CBS 690.94]|uniref:C2H2-type domain-containing protein n=1 Tax=Karstenula rhodostoma CBS 690.94 TaxID=1392251 RepID=A0A9P4PQK0_9PLEO|nr:hypothetical protein P171DRAFT_430023 [Karstenula rhodostoma CBS 690.94]